MLKLEDREWEVFNYEVVFPFISRGKRLKKDDHVSGRKPYVSSTANNNGVDAFIGNDVGVRQYEDCLTVANSGSVGTAFFHPYEFVASDHVTSLKNPNFNEYVYKFLIPLVQRLQEKYSFNREINDRRIRRESILLPVDHKGDPDWEFMAAYMREQEKLMLEKVLPYFKERLLNNLLALGALPDSLWGGAKLSDLFTITIGKNLDGNKIDRDSGCTPYVTRKETSNGLDGFTGGHDEKYLWSQVPAITIGNETAKPFVQTHEFYTGTKVNILTPKKPMSVGVLQFIARCIEANKDRYSYSYTANSTRLGEQRLMLPITVSGELNTAYMESEIARIENETLDYATRLLQERYDELIATITLRGGELEDREWADFFIDDLFELQPGKSKGLNHLKVTGGINGIQYLGATNRNNGVLAFVEPVSSQIQLGNAIAFIRNGEGSMGYSIYKGAPFIATSDITAGYNDNLNRFNGNFIVSVADRARGKYNFGYKRSDKRLKKERLTLIRHPNGQPDWDAMSNYAQAQETLVLMRQLFRLG